MPWVSISGAPAGQGDGTIPYTVSANEVPLPRSGALTIASTTVQLSQAAAPCQFALNRTQASIGAAGGQVSAAVSTLAGCSWTAASGDPWITVAAGQSATASGTVMLAVAANAGAARVGHASIAGQAFTLSQEAAQSVPVPPSSGHVEGAVKDLTGRCPNLQFLVAGTTVATDKATVYAKKATCDDVRAGVNVAVDGIRDVAVLRAQTVEIKK